MVVLPNFVCLIRFEASWINCTVLNPANHANLLPALIYSGGYSHTKFRARSDKRGYRRVVLPNVLERLLISDADTDKVRPPSLLLAARKWRSLVDSSAALV
ncbi:hypothetical protein E2562_019340 [Oryza meyeriana var. granulata]|uniref:Uncharacterized protein n=1 Tax=Oryza meyeriana var. granulata TaxID=110450 RepID=A0A6G1BLJ8_9ORYZ|nr:hypothetical protein E2562_019340 [Oryza meyeriana var. granulata]